MLFLVAGSLACIYGIFLCSCSFWNSCWPTLTSSFCISVCLAFNNPESSELGKCKWVPWASSLSLPLYYTSLSDLGLGCPSYSLCPLFLKTGTDETLTPWGLSAFPPMDITGNDCMLLALPLPPSCSKNKALETCLTPLWFSVENFKLSASWRTHLTSTTPHPSPTHPWTVAFNQRTSHSSAIT